MINDNFYDKNDIIIIIIKMMVKILRINFVIKIIIKIIMIYITII